MRIGIDVRLWNETGVGRYTRNLIKYLQILDKENEYVLFVGSENYEDLKSQIKNLKWKIVKTDIRWHSVEEQIKFPRILNKENLDLVHFPYFSVPIFYNKPFVVTIHDLILHNFPTGEASTLPLPLYKTKLLGYKFIISRISKKAKKIIVPTNSVKDEAIRRLHIPSSKIEVTYEGVDENLKSKVKSQKSKVQFKSKKFLLYIGNAYPHKNLKRLIAAFQKFESESDKDVKLVLAGRKDYFYRKLEDFISKNNLNNIQIIYTADDELLSYLYKNAIALIVPSLMEGFGLTAIEAMSNGCLVLASDIPALKEVCRDSAVYFDPYNIEDIKEKIKLVCLNTSKYDIKTIIGKGVNRASNFSWKKMAEETLKIYESSIGLR
jgi:glycosyltransferase involved in cell wall biosynthesis